MAISSASIQKLLILLRPYLRDENERRAYLLRALGMNAPVLNRLILNTSVDVFITNMVNELVAFGDIAPGQPALCVLLEVIREDVGVNNKARIDELLQQLREKQLREELKPKTEKPNPPQLRRISLQEAFYLLVLHEIRNQPELENELGKSIADTAQIFCGHGLNAVLREFDRGQLIMMEGTGFKGIQDKAKPILIKPLREFFYEPISMMWGKSANYITLCRTALIFLYYCRLGEAEKKISLATSNKDDWAYAHHVYGLLKGLQKDFAGARFEFEIAQNQEKINEPKNRIERALRLVSYEGSESWQ